MNDLELKAFLREVGKERQETAHLQAPNIRTLANQRLRRRRLANGLVLSFTLLLTGATFYTYAKLNRSSTINRSAPAYMASAQAMRAHIEEEARARLDRRRAATALAVGEMVSLEDAREEAARTMVTLAPRRGELAGIQEAAAVYRQTIALFPETSSAQQARTALGLLHLEN